MERLSASLVAKIRARPLNTNLTSDNKIVENVHKNSLLRVSQLENLPQNFDGPKIWKDFLTAIKNQGTCGSCWAWASVSSLGDRINLLTRNLIHVELTPLRPLLCDLEGQQWNIQSPEFDTNVIEVSKILSTNVGKVGCHGSTLLSAWKYLFTIGTNLEKCLSYEKKKAVYGPDTDRRHFADLVDYSSDAQLPLCTDITGPEGDMCGNYYRERETGSETGTPARFFRAISYYTIPGTSKQGGDEKDIMSEIYRNGPVTTGMVVYGDFYTFDPKSTIYKSSETPPRVGGHAIRLVGWGEENGEKFWWIANSWGESWGLNGFFKMIRGENNCQIEENVVAGLPDIFYPLGIILPTLAQKTRNKVPDDAQEKRLTIDYGDGLNGGGIDPRTGYTRRTQYRYTGFSGFKPLLTIEQVLKINNEPFIAGQVTNPNRRPPIADLPLSAKRSTNESVDLFLIIFCSVSFLILFWYCFSAVHAS